MDKYQSFLKDMENNIKNKEDLEYIKQRFEEFKEEYSDKKVRIEEIEVRVKMLEEAMKKVKEEIYLEEDIEQNEDKEEDYQFEIGCPFCNTEFMADINEKTKQIICPNCKKEIDLDWSDDFEDFGGCGGSCGACGGCGIEDDM